MTYLEYIRREIARLEQQMTTHPSPLLREQLAQHRVTEQQLEAQCSVDGQ